MKAREACQYDVENDAETRQRALKRKFGNLEREHADLQELLRALKCRSESEAMAVLRRLRSERDPSSVLQLVRDSELLLQAFPRNPANDEAHDPCDSSSEAADGSRSAARNTAQEVSLRNNRRTNKETANALSSVIQRRKYQISQQNLDRIAEVLELYQHLENLPEPAVARAMQRIRRSDDPLSILYFIQHSGPVFQQAMTSPDKYNNDDRFSSLNKAALDEALVQVPARPWTIIAGDGIVSHLISTLFDREFPGLMRFIDQAAFLADMIKGDIDQATYCSPLLVNAMCAFGGVSEIFRYMSCSD